MLQPFIFLCSDESNPIVGWFVHNVKTDRDTHPSHVVSCYFIYPFADVE